jgi:outer membrane cobalamin receptor
VKKYISLLLLLTLWVGSGLAQTPEQILVVTAERLPTAISQTAASVIVLEQKDLATMGGITSALRSVVGTQVRQYGGSASVASFSIRGSSASQVLVLVDGLPLATAQMPNQDFSIIPMEQIERIEILKGPASSLYGANAVGGVVNIITRKIDKPSTTVELSANSFQAYQGRFLYETWGEQFDWAISGGAAKGQDHRPESEYQKGNLWAKVQLPLEEMILTGTVSHYQDDKSLPSPFGTGQQKDRQDRLTASLRGDALTANLLFRNYWQHYKDAWSLSEHKNRALYIDGQYSLSLSGLPFLIGGDLAYDEVKSTNFSTDAEELLRGGFFFQQKSELDLGLMRTVLRYDYHSSFGSYLSPSWNFLVPINKELTSWIGVAKAFRAPSMNELYWNDPSWNMYGNPDLKPETALNSEFGLRLTQEKQQVELVSFIRKVENFIQWLYENGATKAVNQDSHLFYGLEMKGTWEISPKLFLTCGYTFTEGKNITEDTQALYTPKHTATCGLTFASGLLKGQIDGMYQSEQLTGTSPATMPSRAVFGCQLSYPIGEGKLTLRVDNLTDEKYEEQAGYQMAPRNFTLSFKQAF